MKASRLMAALGVTVTLSGCSGASKSAQPAAPQSSSAASTTSTITGSPTTSPGDLAACKAYARTEPQANVNLKDIGANATSTLIISGFFGRLATDLETGMVAATSPDLVGSAKGAVAGARSAKATSDAWKSGNLDLIPDLTVLYQNTKTIAALCGKADPAGTYKPIANTG